MKCQPILFSKSAFCADIKLFNSFPPSVTILRNNKTKFQAALRKYLPTHSFYFVDEFFVCKMIYTIFVKCLYYFTL